MKGKYKVSIVVLILMMLSIGCVKKETAKTSDSTLLLEDHKEENKSENVEQISLDGDSKVDIGRETTGISKERESSENRELLFIGGKVRSVLENSFVISRTLWEESKDGQGAMVVIPEAGSPEEELTAIQPVNSAVFERWTIQEGGADIIKEEASFSEIQEGVALEAYGYFDKEEFMAEKVIIEIYE